MNRDTLQAVRDACLWLPEAEEFLSHGSPSFRVRGKTFASFVLNHHGDGRVALWLPAAPGVQDACVSAEPTYFFVPPYLGPRGWLGVNLDRGLAWSRVAILVRQAYEGVAPLRLRQGLPATPRIAAPDRKITAGDRDPLQSARGRALLKLLRSKCLQLPESHEVSQFGHPAWQAGKRTFAWVRHAEGRFLAGFKVGVAQQSLLTADPRFTLPAYVGHQGWITLDVTAGCDATEIESLALQSYRLVALRRMLKALPLGLA